MIRFSAMILALGATESTKISTPPLKLRGVCLHCFQGSGKLFKVQLRNLLADTHEIAEFVYLDGPVQLMEGKKSYSWWDSRPAVSGTCKMYDGFEEAYDSINAASASSGSSIADIFIGHSQGAAAAVKYLQRKACSTPLSPKSPTLFIGIGGFPPQDYSDPYNNAEALRDYYSLHLIGCNDDVVLPSWSLTLADMFQKGATFEGRPPTGPCESESDSLRKSAVLVHEGDHAVPLCSASRQAVRDSVAALHMLKFPNKARLLE